MLVFLRCGEGNVMTQLRWSWINRRIRWCPGGYWWCS